MLYLFLLVSLLFSCGYVYFMTGFASLRSIWMVPAAFAVIFVGLLLLFLLLVVISALVVDRRKEAITSGRWYRFLLTGFTRLAFTLGGVTIHTTGLEKLPKGQRVLLVSNHKVALDPLIYYLAMPELQLAFMAKKEAFSFPLVAQYMHKLRCLPVDRENDRAALRSIIKAIEYLKKDLASIAVFPEGGTNRTDALLLSYKNGVFKIAQKANVPIVVCAVTNTRDILKNLFRRHTDVYLDVLGVLPPDGFSGCTTIDIGGSVRAIMEDGLRQRASAIHA